MNNSAEFLGFTQRSESAPNYAERAIARKHHVSIHAAKLIAELQGMAPVIDDWVPLAIPVNSIVGRLGHLASEDSYARPSDQRARA